MYHSYNPLKTIVCKQCGTKVTTISRTRTYCTQCAKDRQAIRTRNSHRKPKAKTP